MEINWEIVGIGFAAVSLAYACVRNIKNDFRERITGVETELSLLRADVQDIDRRMCRLEGAFAAKECCMLRHDHKEKVQ